MSYRCSICPNTHRCVAPDGPLDAEIFCIGERPGYEEDEGGVPFIGRAGREFNFNYLILAGLDRDSIRIDNTVSCRADMNRTPTDKEIWGCAPHHIPKQLQIVKPKVVLLMGGTACKLMEQHGQTKPDLDAEHGIPRWGRLWDWEGWIVPMYHPAAGLHNTTMMTPMFEDWEKLRWWLEDGKWMWAEDKYPEKDYRLLNTRQEVYNYFEEYGGWWLEHGKPTGGDTESHAGTPYSLQVSIRPGTGVLVKWSNTYARDALTTALLSWGGGAKELLFHYAPADLPMFEQAGMGGIPYRDTMQEAYGLLIYPQALKVIARRYLGRVRKSWEETVEPPSKKELGKWMRRALSHAEEHWRVVTPRFHKRTGKPLKSDVKLSTSEKLLPALYGFMMNNPDYKIWEKLVERMDEKELQQLVNLFGPWPVRGVAHLSIEELVEYGCSDADDTLTFGIMAEKMRKEFVEGLNFQEEDRDR